MLEALLELFSLWCLAALSELYRYLDYSFIHQVIKRLTVKSTVHVN